MYALMYFSQISETAGMYSVQMEAAEILLA